METATVHREILRQLGGNHFIAMTGCKHLTYSSEEDNYLSMHLTRNKLGAQYLKIVLMPTDTYTMIFSKSKKVYETIGGHRFCISDTLQIIKSIEGVYDDMLQTIFTKETGLYTHL